MMKPHHVTFLCGVGAGGAVVLLATAGNYAAAGVIVCWGIFLISRH